MNPIERWRHKNNFRVHGTNKKYSPETIEFIKRLRNQGIKWELIGHHYGITRQGAFNILKRYTSGLPK